MEFVQIIAILGILAAILIGIPSFKSWNSKKKEEKQKNETLFKNSGWINASQLTYSSLDFNRKMMDEKDPSYQRGVSESILRILNERKEEEKENHILLVGPSLSGKTHITVSVLKKMPNAYILIPNDSTFSQVAKESYYLPDAPQDAQYKIVLFDNFHEFFKGSDVTPRALIHKAIEKGFTLWANCISIEEYDRVNSSLDFKDGILGPFKEIKLDKKMTVSEAETIAKEFGEKIKLSFNGLIGEIFLKPDYMKKQYIGLKSDTIARDVLLFIKQAYMLGAFTTPFLMKYDLLKNIYAKRYNDSYSHLISALRKIEQKGFITILNDFTHISFESVWLNEIVEPELKAKEFYHYWDDIIPKNVVHYTNLMHTSKDYSDALSYYQDMIKEGIVPNARPYTILISLSPNYGTALEWFNKIEEGKADVVTYCSLINISPNYDTALEWFNKIEEGKANVIVYNSLINKSPNYDTALKWFNKIEEGKADGYTFNSLINKSPNYGTALEWFEKIEKGDATEVTYNSLIVKSPNYDTALEWLHKMETENCRITSHTFWALSKIVTKSCNKNRYQLAMGIHDEMLKKGMSSNVDIYTHLVNLSPNFDKGFELLEIMVTKKDKKGELIKPNRQIKEAIIKKISENYTALLDKVDIWFREHTNGEC